MLIHKLMLKLNMMIQEELYPNLQEFK